MQGEIPVHFPWHPVHLLHDGLLRIAENAFIRNPSLMRLISLLPDPFSSDPEKRHTSLPFVPPSSVPVFGQQKRRLSFVPKNDE
jgi:hypothetical protein